MLCISSASVVETSRDMIHGVLCENIVFRANLNTRMCMTTGPKMNLKETGTFDFMLLCGFIAWLSACLA